MLPELIQKLSDRAVTSKGDDAISALRELRSALRDHISGVKEMAAQALFRTGSPSLTANRKPARPASVRPSQPSRLDDRRQRSLLVAGMILTELLYADQQMREGKPSLRPLHEGEGSLHQHAD